MSATFTYTTDSLGFIPRLWQIWRDARWGVLRCIRRERAGRNRYTLTVEALPDAWEVKR